MRNPVSIGDQDERARRLKDQIARQAMRSDALYVAGAVFVTAGTGFFNWKVSLIVGGLFFLLPPLLELASGFVKGLRSSGARR